MVFGEQMAGIFGDVVAFANDSSGVTACGVDGGRADNESHAGV